MTAFAAITGFARDTGSVKLGTTPGGGASAGTSAGLNPGGKCKDMLIRLRNSHERLYGGRDRRENSAAEQVVFSVASERDPPWIIDIKLGERQRLSRVEPGSLWMDIWGALQERRGASRRNSGSTASLP